MKQRFRKKEATPITMKVRRAHLPFRFPGASCARVACLLVGLVLAGCVSKPEAPRLAVGWKEAEIAVTNLTPYPWRIALRSPAGADIKTVQVQPRETFAVVVEGGDYVVEQTLVAADPTVGTTRNFAARFEAGERYRWSLATLLSSETAPSP